MWNTRKIVSYAIVTSYFISQVMTIRTTKIGISIPTEIFESIENIRTKSNRSKFVLELLLPELNRRMRSVE